MRDKLTNEIMMVLISEGVQSEKIKSRLVLLLNNYEVTARCTEVAVIDESDIEKYLRLFLINKRVAGRSERTLQHYQAEMCRFFREVQKSPLEITSDDIKVYLATKEIRDKVSKVTQKNCLRVISSFFQWMQREEYILKNPMNKVDEIKTPKVKKEAFTDAQIEQLRFSIGEDTRLLCIFELLVSTWCRVSELANIKISEIADDMESVIVHGKGGKDRICYINARAKICLQKYLSQRSDSNEYLFANSNFQIIQTDKRIPSATAKKGVKLRDWWKVKDFVGEGHLDKSSIESLIRKLGKRAGVEKTHPHRFRRTGATSALRRGMPIEQVSRILGHESIETTQIYLDINEREVEAAHRKFV